MTRTLTQLVLMGLLTALALACAAGEAATQDRFEPIGY
jgi:hypothetical protein